MFTIDSEAEVLQYPFGGTYPDSEDSGAPVHSRSELAALLSAKPGAFAVQLWNQLPGVTPIHTPPGEPSPKFRNKATAVERIWSKLCELYPDAVSSEDMPKKKPRYVVGRKMQELNAKARKVPVFRMAAPAKAKTARNTNGSRKSAWAEELTTELRKRFNPGQDFSLEDVYKLIPAFQRRHKENHHVAARLRTTLAQDLRGAGVVKALKRGRYRMLGA